MKILITHIYAWPEVRRGGERYMHELASALMQAGHDVTIITTGRKPTIGSVMGVEVHYLRRRRIGALRSFLAHELPFALQALTRALAMRIDVWHALGRTDAAAAAIHTRLRGSVSVYTALGMPELPSNSSRSNWALQKFLIPRIDHYLTLSREAGRLLEEGWGRKTIVVGGGVNTKKFRPSPRAEQPTILYSGNLNVPRKNVRQLIEAISLVAQELPSVKLWLSGPGAIEPLVEGLSQELKNRIVFFGQQEPDEIVALYGQAWVTALPSNQEAFGLTLIESLACGTPVVALAEGGGMDIVTASVGAIAANAAPHLIANACLKALTMTKEPDIIQRCRTQAKVYDWGSAIVPRLVELYRHRDGDRQARP